MNNNFRLKFLPVLVVLFLFYSFCIQAKSVGGGQSDLDGSRLKKYASSVKEDECSKLKNRVAALNKAMAKLEIIILKKQAAIDIVQDKLTQVSSSKNSLEKQFESLENKYSRLESDFIAYRRENKRVKKENDYSKANFAALNKAKANFQKTLSKKENMIRKLESKLSKANSQESSLKNKIKAFESKSNKLKGDISSSGEDYNQAKTKITYLNGELASLAEDKAGVEVILSKKEAVIWQLKSDLSKANSQESSLKNQIKTLENKQNRLKSDAFSSDKEYVQGKIKITHLREEVVAVTKERDEVEAILLKKERQVKDLRSRLDKGDLQRADLERQISILKSEQNKLKSELMGMNKQYLVEKSLIKDLGDKLNRVEIENNKITRKIKTVGKEHQELKKKFVKLNGENKLVVERSKLLKLELDNSNKIRDRSIVKLTSSKILAKKLQDRLNQIDSGGEVFKAQITMLKDEKSTLANKLSGVNKDCKLAQGRILFLEKDLKKWGNDKIDLQFILSNKEILAEGLQLKLEKSIFESKAFEKQIFNLNEERKRIEQENRILNKDIEVLEEIKTVLKLELDGNEILVRETQDKLTQAFLERDDFKKETKDIEEEMKTLSSDLKLAKDLNASFRNTFTKEKAKIRTLEGRLTKASPQRKEQKKIIKALQSERDELKSKFEKVDEKHRLAKNEIASLEKNSSRAGRVSLDKDFFDGENKIFELETKLTEISLDRNYLQKRAKDAEEDGDKSKSEFAKLNEYYQTVKKDNIALRDELKKSQLAYIKEVNSFSKIEKENWQLVDELDKATKRCKELEGKWGENNKELVSSQKSTSAGREEKKRSLTRIYDDLVIRSSKFFQEDMIDSKEKIYQTLGYAYSLDGNFEEAIAFYRKALKINDKSKDVYYNLGYAYVQVGKYELAVSAYQQSLRGGMDDDDIYYNLAVIYGKYLKNEEKSNEYYEKISDK